ncbi:MAG: DUF503 domain-containing protein [Deltaproteobacteria bacterium]|nr:DUF503 domain-containing protein [Deltaproteobacteria bacterium]
MGFLTVALLLEGNISLKEKRRVVKSLLGRVRSRFNVSASEVGEQDVHAQALLGFSVCGPDGKLLRSVLDRVLNFVETNADAEVVDSEIVCPIFDDEGYALAGAQSDFGEPELSESDFADREDHS